MAQLRRNKIRTAAEEAGESRDDAVRGDAGFDTVADLVAELIAATGFVPPDRLAAARGRAPVCQPLA
jgi:hypothetical protein